jgi:hypothetical protein
MLKALTRAFRGKVFKVGIVGARGSAKSWTVALAIALWFQHSRNFTISIMPCGSGAQAHQMMRYFNSFYPARLRDGRHWSAMEMRDKRGNVLLINTPTANGARSTRGNCVIFEEAEQGDEELFSATIPQIPKHGSIVFLGTAEGAEWERWYQDCDIRIKITWKMMVDAGIGDMNQLTALKETLSERMFKQMYEAEWVHESCAFNVVPGVQKGITRCSIIGVDVNRNPGYTWTLVTWDGKNITIKTHGTCNLIKDFIPVLEKYKPNAVWVESNTSIQDTDVLWQETWMATKVPVKRHLWNEKTKAANVEAIVAACEKGILISEDKNITRMMRNQKFDGDKMIKVKGPTDWVDATMHAVWGVDHDVS